MQFCTNCGRNLNLDGSCDCQQSSQSDQYQTPQYPQTGQYQNPQTPQYPQTGQYQNPQTPQYPQTGQYQNPQTPQYPQTGQYQNPQQPPFHGTYGQEQFPVYQGKPPGQTQIRVAGVLMIIFGAIAFFASLATLESLNDPALSQLMPEGLKNLIGFEVFMAFATCVAGIIGVAFASKREKAGIIIGLGVAIVVMRIIDVAWGVTAFGDAIESSVIVGALLGAALPALFISGGNKLKNSV